jgi:hypothetical protein
MSPSEATRPKVEATNLVALSSFLRPSSGSVKPAITNAMARLPGSSPFKKIALSAIEASNIHNRARDVSMMGTNDIQDSLTLSRMDSISDSPMDDKTKETVKNMEKAVVLKAQDMAGVTAPLGFFDPLGFSTDCDEGKLLFYREVELKHGRVAMLATLGLVVGEQFHPLFGGNIDVPSYVAFQQTPLQAFWPAVVAAIALPEIFSVFSFEEPGNLMQWDKTWRMKSDRQPGELGFDPLGLKPQNYNEFKEMQTKELNNGRLAMIAAAGMIAQEIATGQKLF